jgi:uncharacterized protein (TIGR00106 family)
MSCMIAAFSITPIGTGESVGDLVADSIRIVRASGLPNETNAMFTNIEGEWDEVMAVIKACVDSMAEVVPRVSVVIKVDHRPGELSGRIKEKVESVERRLRNATQNG